MGIFGLFAHAFGQRYELPIPLVLFVFGGASIVLLSFLLVLQTQVPAAIKIKKKVDDHTTLRPINYLAAAVSFIVLGSLIAVGLDSV